MKYCGSCGCQLSDTAKFCQRCGAQQEVAEVQPVAGEEQVNAQPVQNAEQQVNAQPVQSEAKVNMQSIQDSVRKFMSNRNHVIAVGAIAAVIIIIMFVRACGGGSRSMEGAVETYYEAICDKDADALYDIVFCDSFEEAVKKEFGADAKELKEQLERGLQYSYEDWVKVRNIKVTDKERAKDSEVRDMLEEIKDDTGVNVKISEMYELEVSFEYYDKDYKEWRQRNEDIGVYKSGSGWYVIPD